MQSIWALTNDEHHCREPIIADGFPEILYLIKGSLKIFIGDKEYTINSHAYIGIVDKSSYFELEPNTIILSFKLMPWMTSNIIKDEARHAKNQVINLDDLAYDSWLDKAFDLDKDNTLESLIYHVIYNELPHIFKNKKSIPSALIIDVFSQFDSLKKLSNSVRTIGSSRYFEKLYSTHIGISPMRYKRLLKIKKSTLIFAEKFDSKIEPLALALGYYDLSHFYKDFFIFTNDTPNGFKNKSHNSILLDDNNYKSQYIYS
ncbi:helix-turn-helix domain-containing protein [uncultured Psychroserpens sp.]|uniref:helix-turn-helix domain-containing protein n=1 Tax=uncultured Psychroserpens sp. TaxID=255436 RepID=UPI00262C5F9A|nr:helix-turn-helix domain-containing protein [uncultured Psychroserpens sp.]